MAKTPQEIDATATAMHQAGAPDEDIRAYVQAALAEGAAPQQAAPASVVQPDTAQPAASPFPSFDQTRDLLDRQQKTMGRVGMAASPMVVPGAGVIPMATRALVGGGSYLLDAVNNGETPQLSKLAKNMFFSAAPLPSPGVSAATNIAKGAAAGAGTAALGNAIEQSIDQGTPDIKWDEYKTSLKDAIVPALIGSAALGVGGKLQAMQKMQAEADAGMAAAKELGLNDPMLGDVIPKHYGAMQQKIVSIDPSMRAKQDAARAPMARAIFATATNAPQNEEIAARIRPILTQADELDAAYQKSQALLDEAQALRAKARADATISAADKAAIEKGAIAETIGAIQSQAEQNIALNVGPASQIRTQTGFAGAIQDIVKKAFGVRGQVAGEMLSATGIMPDTPIIGTDALYESALNALTKSGKEKSGAGIAILDTIKSWGSKTAQDMAATKQLSMEQLARKAQLEGRDPAEAIRAAFPSKATVKNPDTQRVDLAGNPMAPAVPSSPVQSAAAVTAPQQKFLTLDEFRSLRDGLSDGFFGKVDSNNMNAAEKLASDVYHAISDTHVKEIGRLFPDAVAPYEKFRQFWRETSKIRDSDFGRALLRGEVADSTVTSMADKLASGNVDEIKNFRQFIDTIRDAGSSLRGDAPVLAKLNDAVSKSAMTTMASAVRNSFLEKASDAAGVNHRALFDMLQRYASKADSPFPVDLFGFGGKETIAGASKALRDFKPHELTAEGSRAIFESPQIQAALRMGSKEAPDQIKKAAATVAFTKRVNDAVQLRESGAIKKAREAFVEANALAKRAGVDAQAAQVAMQAAENNPLTGVWKAGGKYTLGNEGTNLGAEGSVSSLVNNLPTGEARAFMGALRTSKPDLAEMVERRMVADALNNMTRPEKNISGQIANIDVPKVRAFFEPGLDGTTNPKLLQLRAAIGDEKAERLRKFASGVAKMDDASRASMIKAGLPNEVATAAEFARTGQSGSIQSGRSLGSMIRQGYNMMRTQKFNLASAMLLDDGALNAFSRNSGNYAAALAELQPQRAWLLLQDARVMNELGQKPNDRP